VVVRPPGASLRPPRGRSATRVPVCHARQRILARRSHLHPASYVAPRHREMELTGSNGAPLEAERHYDFKALSPDELRLLVSLLKKADVRRTNEQL
jgi:hypothetical protein